MHTLINKIALVLIHPRARKYYGVIVGSATKDPRTHTDIDDIAVINPGFDKTKTFAALQNDNAWFDVIVSDGKATVDESNADAAFKRAYNHSITWEHF